MCSNSCETNYICETNRHKGGKEGRKKKLPESFRYSFTVTNDVSHKHQQHICYQETGSIIRKQFCDAGPA